LITQAFSELPDLNVQLFYPEGAPKAVEMKIATKRPGMTPGRAVILEVLNRYVLPEYRLSLLEIQKLAYFMQEAGEPLRFKFVKQQYGPYAENLHHVLQAIEGHFVRGYGDRSRDVSLELYPDAVREAGSFLVNEADTQQRLDRVTSLIEGYETPYGLELLSTVHWVVIHDSVAEGRIRPANVTSAVHSWNEHKRRTFTGPRIEAAWQRLKSEGWFQ
jgi:hypothetical protein